MPLLYSGQPIVLSDSFKYPLEAYEEHAGLTKVLVLLEEGLLRLAIARSTDKAGLTGHLP